MKTILVPVDFNPLATTALRYAALIAERTGAKLIVVYADTFDPPAEFTAMQTASLVLSIEDSRRKTIEELGRYASENAPSALDVQTDVREALPVPGILAAIEEHRPDLVIMGTHGRAGLARFVFGSVTEAVLAATTVPVLTINRVDAVPLPQNILCLSTRHNPSGAAESISAELAATLGARSSTVRVTRDSAAEVFASPDMFPADLIVMGEEIREITRHAPAPVLHVRDTGSHRVKSAALASAD